MFRLSRSFVRRAPRNIHDQTFSALMLHRSFAVGFYRAYLPEDILCNLNFDTLELFNVSGKVISEKDRATSQVDVVHTIKFKQQDLMLWTHIEHQSTAERFMPIRIGHYQCGKLLEYAKLNKCQALPPILTIIYHQGLRPYLYSVDPLDCFADKQLATLYFMRPKLIDLPSMPDQELSQHQIGPAELILKYIRGQAMNRKYRGIIKKLRVMDDKIRYLLIDYLVTTSDIDFDALVDAVLTYLPEDKEKIMTPAEQLLQRGMQKGVMEGQLTGKTEVAINMLQAGEHEDKVVAYTGLDRVTVLSLKDRL